MRHKRRIRWLNINLRVIRERNISTRAATHLDSAALDSLWKTSGFLGLTAEGTAHKVNLDPILTVASRSHSGTDVAAKSWMPRGSRKKT